MDLSSPQFPANFGLNRSRRLRWIIDSLARGTIAGRRPDSELNRIWQGAKTDANGSIVRREVGWREHLGRNILGAIEKLFTGKDTFSPDSHDSANFAERYKRAQEESNAYVKGAETAASQKPPEAVNE